MPLHQACKIQYTLKQQRALERCHDIQECENELRTECGYVRKKNFKKKIMLLLEKFIPFFFVSLSHFFCAFFCLIEMFLRR